MEKIIAKVGWSGENYSALIEDVGGMVIATGNTLEDVKEKIKDSLEFHIEGIIEDNGDLPEDIAKGKYELEFELQASAILKTLDGTITRVALSKYTGINERQLGHYIQGKKQAKEEARLKIIQGIKKINESLLEVI